MIVATGKIVRYYSPFTTYNTGDQIKVGLAIFCACSVGMMLFLAAGRWRQGRRSATLFLFALSASLIVEAIAFLHGLGHPPVYWIIGLYFVPPAMCIVACAATAGEIRRGVWSL